jgi:hypothetical protein
MPRGAAEKQRKRSPKTPLLLSLVARRITAVVPWNAAHAVCIRVFSDEAHPAGVALHPARPQRAARLFADCPRASALGRAPCIHPPAARPVGAATDARRVVPSSAPAALRRTMVLAEKTAMAPCRPSADLPFPM